MKMETENKEGGPNQNHISTTSKLESNPHQNGHCGITGVEWWPSGSENKCEDDLSDIPTKVSKVMNTRAQIPNAHQSGPSQRDGRGRDASCGIYYGIRSYLHHFYGPPDKEVLKSGEYVQGDDFRFLAEPQRRSCWVRSGLWFGLNLVLLGSIAMLVGYLTPPRQAIVGQYEEFTVLDRWAVNFNYHLMMCQLVGLITFSFGAIVVVCSLIVANCRQPAPPPAYLVMGAYLTAPTSGKHADSPPSWGIHCIPLSGTLKSVQPQFIRSQY